MNINYRIKNKIYKYRKKNNIFNYLCLRQLIDSARPRATTNIFSSNQNSREEKAEKKERQREIKKKEGKIYKALLQHNMFFSTVKAFARLGQRIKTKQSRLQSE